MTPQDMMQKPFGTLPDLVAASAKTTPDAIALIDGDVEISYAQLNANADQLGSALQKAGVGHKDVVAVCAPTSAAYITLFVATLRIGAAIAPLTASAHPETLTKMLVDCGAKVYFCEDNVWQAMAAYRDAFEGQRISLSNGNEPEYLTFLASGDAHPTPVDISPDDYFNIIYSSGTTGMPKGIIQTHKMRWAHINRSSLLGYAPDAVTIVSTPLYSNTTLVSAIPALSQGGKLVLMAKFNADRFLELCDKHRVTHAMLVPVQYQRISDVQNFSKYDLSSFRMKTCTSAPFSAELKRWIVDNWPGSLVEIYGMTEGGGTCLLNATEFPDKLHTVGRPAEGHDIRVIDDDGNTLPAGEKGEVVGRSGAMMVGYHNQPKKTSDAEWFDEHGNRFIRTGDVGVFDEDGFLTLMDRKKDMIISGGFNIYPSDLEAVLRSNDAVYEAAVVGAPSRAWGETPVGFVVLKEGADITSDDLKAWMDERVGKTQRLAVLQLVDTMPRNAIGKVLKTDLRQIAAELVSD